MRKKVERKVIATRLPVDLVHQIEDRLEVSGCKSTYEFIQVAIDEKLGRQAHRDFGLNLDHRMDELRDSFLTYTRNLDNDFVQMRSEIRVLSEAMRVLTDALLNGNSQGSAVNLTAESSNNSVVAGYEAMKKSAPESSASGRSRPW